MYSVIHCPSHRIFYPDSGQERSQPRINFLSPLWYKSVTQLRQECKIKGEWFINVTGILSLFSTQASRSVVLGQMAGLARRPLQLSASEDVNVQVIHGLRAHLPIVDHWNEFAARDRGHGRRQGLKITLRNGDSRGEGQRIKTTHQVDIHLSDPLPLPSSWPQGVNVLEAIGRGTGMAPFTGVKPLA